jgi:capsular exopolysaccharide synthesis family protein
MLTDDPIAQELRRYLMLVRLHWKIIAATTVTTLGATAAYHYQEQPLYRARAQILVESKSGFTLGRSVTRAWNGMNYELEILQSIELARQAAQRLEHDAIRIRVDSPSFWQRFQTRVLGMRLDGVRTQSSVVGAEQLRAMVQAEPVRESSIANLWFTSPDAEFSAAAANAFATAYIEDSRRTRSAETQVLSDMLASSLDDQRSAVAAADSDAVPGDGLDVDDLKEQQTLARGKLESLTAALMSARTERLTKETTYEQLIALADEERSTFPAVMRDPQVAELSARLAELRVEQHGLSATYGELHPEMVRVAAAIEGAQHALEAETARVVDSMEKGYLNALAREERFEASLEPVQEELDGIRERLAGDWTKEREGAVNRDFFGRLVHENRQAQLESQFELNTRRIVTNARAPRERFSPNLTRNYRIAALAGLGIGILLILAREQLADTIETAREVKDRLGVPFLGSVPNDETVPGRGLDLFDPLSLQVEAYRMVRTNLLLSSAIGSDHLLVVTSVSPGEGKSTTVANLAASLARNGSRVLAIDADLRKATLHEKFGLAHSPGLTQLLRDEADVKDVIQPSPIPGLSLIASGDVVSNPAELLGSNRTREVLDELRGQFDWVLVDVPPILAVADTTVITPLVDGLIFVVETERTHRTAVETAIEQAKSVGGRIVGVVLNKVDVKRSAYMGGAYYGSYYRSGYGAQSLPDEPGVADPKRRPPPVS